MRLSKRLSIQNLSLIVLILIFFSFLILSTEGIFKKGGIDLRNRVVGARVFQSGHDPYLFHWHPGMPQEWIDNLASPDFPVSRLTTTPGVLLLHLPFIQMNFTQQMVIWLIFQWVLLFGSAYLFVKATSSQIKRNYIWITTLIFGSTFYWLSHLSVGQVYIFYVFLISLSYYFAKKGTKVSWLASVLLLGIVAALRPPYLLFIIPMFFLMSKEVVLKMFVSFLSTLLITICIFGVGTWKNYLFAMSIQSKSPVMAGGILQKPVRDGNYYPHVIENTTFLNGFSTYSKYDTSIKGNVQRIFGFIPSSLILGLIFITILMLILKPLSSIRPNSFANKTEWVFLIGSLLVLTAEYFIPAARYAYYDIQLILPVLLLIVLIKDFNNIIKIIVLLGFVGYISYLNLVVGYVLTFIFFLYLIWTSYRQFINHAK